MRVRVRRAGRYCASLRTAGLGVTLCRAQLDDADVSHARLAVVAAPLAVLHDGALGGASRSLVATGRFGVRETPGDVAARIGRLRPPERRVPPK